MLPLLKKLLVLRMGKIPPLIGTPYNGCISPYSWYSWWVYPLLYRNDGSLDPGSHAARGTRGSEPFPWCPFRWKQVGLAWSNHFRGSLTTDQKPLKGSGLVSGNHDFISGKSRLVKYYFVWRDELIQLMVNCWFGARWFGIRIGVHPSNNRFHERIPGIQTTNPN